MCEREKAHLIALPDPFNHLLLRCMQATVAAPSWFKVRSLTLEHSSKWNAGLEGWYNARPSHHLRFLSFQGLGRLHQAEVRHGCTSDLHKQQPTNLHHHTKID